MLNLSWDASQWSNIKEKLKNKSLIGTYSSIYLLHLGLVIFIVNFIWDFFISSQLESSQFKNSWSWFPSLLLLISFASKALNFSMWLISLQALVWDHMMCWKFLQFVFLWDVYILRTFHCPWKAHIRTTHIVHLHHPLVTRTIVLSKCYNTSHIPRKLHPFKNCCSNGFDRIKKVAKHEES
jgi:hypothetical protein